MAAKGGQVRAPLKRSIESVCVGSGEDKGEGEVEGVSRVSHVQCCNSLKGQVHNGPQKGTS